MEQVRAPNAELLRELIAKDTLIDSLDRSQLSESLKNTTLNVNESLYIIQKVQSKYGVTERFKAVHHISTDFDDGEKFDLNGFVKFLSAFGKCLHIDVLQLAAKVIKSLVSNTEIPSKRSRRLSYAPAADPMNVNNSSFNSGKGVQKASSCIFGSFDIFGDNSESDASQNANHNNQLKLQKSQSDIYMSPFQQSSSENIFSSQQAFKQPESDLFDNPQSFEKLNYHAPNSLKESQNTSSEVFEVNTPQKADIPDDNNKEEESGEESPVMTESDDENQKSANEFNGEFQIENKNIADMFNLQKISQNFNKIYEIFERIAEENDKESMSFCTIQLYSYVKNECGRDVLCQAASKNNFKLAKSLIQHKVDYNQPDNEGKNAFFWFCSKGNYEAVRFFLKLSDVDVNSATNSKFTALMAASLCGHFDIVTILSKAPGINVNARDKFNHTALMNAASKGDTEIVKVLLTVPGIDIRAKDNTNKTALMLATLYSRTDVVSVLKQAEQNM